jgi:hypothetical protein
MKYMQRMLVESLEHSDFCSTAPAPGRHLHSNRRIEIRPRAAQERAVRIE